MEHPLIPAIRFWLLSGAALAVACLWPHWGLILLGTNCFGWWGAVGTGCCGITCAPCTNNTAHNINQFVITGVTTSGGGCTTGNCGNINATWVTQSGTFHSTPPSACKWNVSGVSSACNNDNLGSLDTYLIVNGSDLLLGVELSFDGDPAKFLQWENTITSASEYDCGFSSLSVSPSAGSTFAKCSNSASTLTLTAI